MFYGECHYTECCYAECPYAECHYAECHYAECCGTPLNPFPPEKTSLIYPPQA